MTDCDRAQVPCRVLVTGEFWHTEYVDLLNGLEVPTTFVRLDKLLSLKSFHECYSAVVIAQSRRNSISQESVDQLRRLIPDTPFVAVLGSWCEGESRSGEPLQGIQRIYWHQWHGQFQQLAELIALRPISPTSDVPRRVLQETDRQRSRMVPPKETARTRPTLGVSAFTLTQFEFAQDALQALDCDCLWMERTAWDGDQPPRLDAMVLDSDSLTENLTKRLVFLRSIAPHCPVILWMNFPRKEEVLELQNQWNVNAVISKPFDLRTLYHALKRVGVSLRCNPPATASVALNNPSSAVAPDSPRSV